MQRVRDTQRLISWINQRLDTSIRTLDELRGGSYVAQLFHSVYPFDLAKIDFEARNDYHYERNYKILQQVFTMHGIDKEFNIQNMIQGEKRRDLFYFLMWVKLHYSTLAESGNRLVRVETYNAEQERVNAIASRKKRVTVMLQNDTASSAACSSPRSSSTRASVHSQFSAFTSYSSRFTATRVARLASSGGCGQSKDLTASALAAVANISPDSKPSHMFRANGCGAGAGGVDEEDVVTNNITGSMTTLASPDVPGCEGSSTGGGVGGVSNPNSVGGVWAAVMEALSTPGTIDGGCNGCGTNNNNTNNNVISSYDWWSLGKLPGTVRFIPRNGSSTSISNMSVERE
eukprot:PhM_4_TR8299/c0_g1_i1/m.41989/K10436/MAPRE; microtubule-associated protein, RP/EB family